MKAILLILIAAIQILANNPRNILYRKAMLITPFNDSIVYRFQYSKIEIHKFDSLNAPAPGGLDGFAEIDKNQCLFLNTILLFSEDTLYNIRLNSYELIYRCHDAVYRPDSIGLMCTKVPKIFPIKAENIGGNFKYFRCNPFKFIFPLDTNYQKNCTRNINWITDFDCINLNASNIPTYKAIKPIIIQKQLALPRIIIKSNNHYSNLKGQKIERRKIYGTANRNR